MAVAVVGTTRVSEADSAHSTKISLPKGPGSIEGLASADISPSLSSGTASYSVPILVPPASAGFGPNLAFAYDSGVGVTELGLGWRLAGMPKLRRRTEEGLPHFDGSDRFEVEGLGIPSELLEMPDGFYRPRYEDGSFVRIAKGRRENEWEARTKVGAVLRFGGSGFIEAEAGDVSAFLLREQRDRHGHRIAYEWDVAEGHALLSRVVWNDFDETARNEVSFDYEDRPDHYRRFSNGIAESLTRRLRSVSVRHGGALVRRYELTYGDGIHPALQAITLVGSDGKSRLPAGRFDYTEAQFEASAEQVVTMKNPPGISPGARDAAIADLDGDGLADLLVGSGGQYRSYLNDDGTQWRRARSWKAQESPSVSLGATGVQLADVDADGAVDLLVKSGVDAFRYFPGSIDSFAPAVAISNVPSFTFEDPDVRVADMDGDRRADVIVTTPAGIAIGYRQGRGWTEPEFVPGTEALQTLRFSNGHVSLCDVNGDRQPDLCALRPGGLTYFLGRGRGRFEPGVSARGVPEFDDAAPFVLEDLNGDGWVDLVRVGVHEVAYALSEAEGVFGRVRVIDHTPTKGPRTSVHYADLNGSGTTDIVWVDVTEGSGAAWRYLELFPEGKAGLLRRIDNGIGKVQTIEYAAASTYAAEARAAGTPWKTRMNVAMPVVRRVMVDASLGDPLVVSEYSYRDGAYDPRERTFAGFRTATEREIGDEWTPTLITESTFGDGLSARVLRGVPLGQVTRSEDGVVFRRTTYTYEARQLEESVGGTFIELAARLWEEVEHIEGTRAPRVVRTEYEQDTHGNLIEERRWGDVATEGDEAFVARTFAEDERDWLLGFVATETLTDGQGTRVAETRKYYDGVPFLGLRLGSVSRGDVTREEAWVGPSVDDFELVLGTKYDTDGNPVETRDARGGGHRFVWAGDRTSIRSESVKLEGGRTLVESAEVDGAYGALTAVTEYNGQTTRYGYDSFGRLTTVVRPGDSDALPTALHSYRVEAPLSRIVTQLRVNSGKEEVEHTETLQDGLGRKRGALTTDAARTLLAGVNLYDSRGNVRRALLPRFVSASAPARTLIQEDSARATETWRDATGRNVRTRSPSGIVSRTDHAPLETRHWDGGQSDVQSPYEHTPMVTWRDGLGRVTSHEQTLGGKNLNAFYKYDATGSLVSRTDPEGATARYRYDGRGRRVLVEDPDQGEHRFSYDETGNLSAHAYPDGKVACFTHDLAGRALTQDSDCDGHPESTRYWDGDREGTGDPLFQGKLVEVVDESGGAKHTFDARGRTVATTLRVGEADYIVRSDFDAQDRERRHFYPDGTFVDIHRNGRGQISGYGRAVEFDYGEDGLERNRRFGTSVHVQSGYDDDGRRTRLQITAPGGQPLEDLRWRYDAGGNLTGIDDRRPDVTPSEDRSEQYTYDNLYRLSAATGTWGSASYRYTASGSLASRKSTIRSQDVRAVRYDKRPHAPVAFDDREVEYDERGRMTTDGERSYEWSDADELVRVTVAGGASETNVYDAEGKRRVRVETAGGNETVTHFIDAWSEVRDGKLARYIVHGGQRIVRLAAPASVDNAGVLGVLRARTLKVLTSSNSVGATLTIVLLFALAARNLGRLRSAAVALGTAATLAMVACACASGSGDSPPDSGPGVAELTDADTLLTTDLLGSLLGETTASGQSTSRVAAYPYGATRYDSSRESHKYAAVPRDAHVGLDAMGARFYAPDLGVFASADPIALTSPERLVAEDFAAANPYAYAKDSPLIAADRDGQFWHVAIGAGIGFLVGGGIEAARQYYTTGKVSEPGRILAAATGGAVNGALVAACPAAGIGRTLAVGGGAGVAGGVAQRLVNSGGKSAGSAAEVALDAGIGVLTAGVVKGGSALVKAAVKRSSAARSRTASAVTGSSGASKDTVSVFHGSIKNGGEILEHGFDPARAPTFVSRDLGAAKDALMKHPDAIPGRGTIIESRIPSSEFNSLMAPLERPYRGFFPYNLNSTEITLRAAPEIQLFNRYIVKP